MGARNVVTTPRFTAVALRHLESPAVRPLSHDLDCWRRRLLQAVLEMRAAGVDRAVIDAEVEATCNALRIVGGFDA